MKAIVSMAHKEMRHILRDPKTMAFIIVMPLMMLFLYGYGINFDIQDIRIAVLDFDHSESSRQFIDELTVTPYFNDVARVDSVGELDRLIVAGDIRMGVIIPTTFEADLKTGRTAELGVYVDGSDGNTASISLGYINAMAGEFNLEHIAERLETHGMGAQAFSAVTTEPRYWYNAELKSKHFIVPGMIAIIMMITGAVATTLTLVTEKENGTIEQLIVSPLRPRDIIFGKTIPYVALSFIGLVLIILTALFVFQVPLRGSLIQLLVLSIIYLVGVLGIGILVSSLVDDLASAMLLSIVITMLPSILFSGFVFPIRNMPEVLQLVSYAVPARYFIQILRGIFLKGVGIEMLWGEILFILLFSVAVFSIAIARFRKRLD